MIKYLWALAQVGKQRPVLLTARALRGLLRARLHHVVLFPFCCRRALHMPPENVQGRSLIRSDAK